MVQLLTFLKPSSHNLTHEQSNLQIHSHNLALVQRNIFWKKKFILFDLLMWPRSNWVQKNNKLGQNLLQPKNKQFNNSLIHIKVTSFVLKSGQSAFLNTFMSSWVFVWSLKIIAFLKVYIQQHLDSDINPHSCSHSRFWLCHPYLLSIFSICMTMLIFQNAVKFINRQPVQHVQATSTYVRLGNWHKLAFLVSRQWPLL